MIVDEIRWKLLSFAPDPLCVPTSISLLFAGWNGRMAHRQKIVSPERVSRSYGRVNFSRHIDCR
jgi:hypothetical protein